MIPARWPTPSSNFDISFLPISNDTVEVSDSIIIKLQFPEKYLNNYKYEFALIRRSGKILLSDQGKTIEQLDKIFELAEPDVVKNLVAILKRYEVIKTGNELVLELHNWDGNTSEEDDEKLNGVKYQLFACVSFMLNMKIFYV